jgi:hypothetical protein
MARVEPLITPSNFELNTEQLSRKSERE